eukprot:5210914-Pyramimonas_sp.AAC.1
MGPSVKLSPRGATKRVRGAPKWGGAAMWTLLLGPSVELPAGPRHAALGVPMHRHAEGRGRDGRREEGRGGGGKSEGDAGRSLHNEDPTLLDAWEHAVSRL